MKYIFFLLAIIDLSLCNAQILDEQTQVVDKPGGEELFQLAEGEEVYTYEPEDGWYKIRKACYIAAADLADEKYLNPGTELMDKDGKKIGKVLAEVRVKEKEKIEHFRKEDQYEVVLEGYLFKTAIEEGTVPEARLEALLKVKNRTEQEEGFGEFFGDCSFEERDFEDLTVHVLPEKNKSVAEEQDFRLMVIYRNKSSLFAVITNDHNVEVEKIKDEFTEEPFRIIYFYKPTSAQRDLIQNKILYTYLAL